MSAAVMQPIGARVVMVNGNTSTERQPMAKELKQGDKVSWQTSQGKTEGTVEKKVTGPTKVKGHTAKPTKDSPEYLVKSAKTGKQAVHKPESLKKT